MTNFKSVMVTAAIVSVLSATAAFAQQPAHPHDPTKQPPAAATPSVPGPGVDAHMAQHMEMCRQMMGQGGMMGGGMGAGMMGPGMMSMPMMMAGDPKQQAEMMAMRGEMMKAMGDIMMKYAQRMQSGK